jgi:ubiquinol-cytochrome c reductase cytochrome c1 subunit
MHGGEEGDAHAAEAPEATVEQMAEDVSAFLMWAAEPQMVERKASGFRNILFLIALTVLLYFTNKALWAKVKRKE